MNGRNCWPLFFLLLSFAALIAEEPVNRIDRYKRQLCNEFKEVGMRPFGSGGSKANNVNRETGLAFSYPIEADISTARYWVVSVIERYLFLVNADPLVRPYMHEYPFGPENCGFSIDFIRNEKNNTLNSVMQAKGCLLYFGRELGNTRDEIIHRETYSEALKIYKTQQQACVNYED